MVLPRVQPALEVGEPVRDPELGLVRGQLLELGLVDPGGLAQCRERVPHALGLGDGRVVGGLPPFHEGVDGGVGAHAGLELVLPGLDELLRVALLERGDEVGGVGHDVLRLQVLGDLSRGTAVRHGERDVLVPGTVVVLAFEQTERGPQDGHDHEQSRDEQRDRRGQGRARADLAPLALFRGHVVVFEGTRQAGLPRVVRRGQHVTVGPVALSVTGAGLPRLSAHEFSPSAVHGAHVGCCGPGSPPARSTLISGPVRNRFARFRTGPPPLVHRRLQERHRSGLIDPVHVMTS